MANPKTKKQRIKRSRTVGGCAGCFVRQKGRREQGWWLLARMGQWLTCTVNVGLHLKAGVKGMSSRTAILEGETEGGDGAELFAGTG